MDEQEEHKRLEELCGGPTRAFALMRLWESHSNPTSIFPLNDEEKRSLRRKNFTKSAERNGYKTSAIKAYLRLVGAY